MLKLSKFKQKPSGKCSCKQNCKSRTPDLKDEVEKKSPDLRLNISPKNTCSPLPRSKQMIIQENRIQSPNSHTEGNNETRYLKYAELAKRLGAWDAVKAKCASCDCGTCCPCRTQDYSLNDEVFNKIYKDMRAFDTNVKESCKVMMIMYDLL